MSISFIKLDVNIMNDTKIKLIRKMPDGDSLLVLWVGVLCLGMKSGKPGVLEIGDGIPFTAEALSVELDIPLNTVRLGLKSFEDLKMIEILGNGQTYILNFEKHQSLGKIAAIKNKSRESSNRYRKKQRDALLAGRINNDGHVTVTSSSQDGHVTKSDATDLDKDLDKEKQPCPIFDQTGEKESDFRDGLFDKFWKAGLRKDGKKKARSSFNRLLRGKSEKSATEFVEMLISDITRRIPLRALGFDRLLPATYLNGERWTDEATSNDSDGGWTI